MVPEDPGRGLPQSWPGWGHGVHRALSKAQTEQLATHSSVQQTERVPAASPAGCVLDLWWGWGITSGPHGLARDGCSCFTEAETEAQRG